MMAPMKKNARAGRWPAAGVRCRSCVALLRAAVTAAQRAGGRLLRAGALAGRCRALAARAHAARRHAAGAGRAGRATAARVERVVLVARELVVVVPVKLGKARVELGCVLRLVARDVAVVV